MPHHPHHPHHPHRPRPASRELLIEILRLHFPWGFDLQPPAVAERMLSVLDPIDHEEAAGVARGAAASHPSAARLLVRVLRREAERALG